MNPFEELLKQLGNLLDITLQPDSNQSCLIRFPAKDIPVQIDLDHTADQILIGTQIARIDPGPYRNKVFSQALRVNGTSTAPRGTLAFSEKNDSLVLFHTTPLAYANGQKLFDFLQLFLEHASIWKQCCEHGEIPVLEDA